MKFFFSGRWETFFFKLKIIGEGGKHFLVAGGWWKYFLKRICKRIFFGGKNYRRNHKSEQYCSRIHPTVLFYSNNSYFQPQKDQEDAQAMQTKSNYLFLPRQLPK
jgi:hypothetical protein